MNEVEFQKVNEVAQKIIRVSQNSLILNLKFMDSALLRLSPIPAPTTFITDGVHIYYGPEFVIGRYKYNPNRVIRDVLHMTLHCVFRHSFINGQALNQKYWDIACDIAVEAMMNDLHVNCLMTPEQTEQRSVTNDLLKKVKLLNAEQIYSYYKSSGLSDAELERLEKLFSCDCHDGWYEPSDSQDGNSQGDGDGNSQDQGENGEGDSDGAGQNNDESDNESDNSNAGSSAQDRLSQEWEKVSEQIQMDLETFSKEQGTMAGGMVQQLQELNREKYDYTSFLKKFAVMGETMRINDDEFDYVFYTYGLKLFGNVPLIEPLEYKEEKRIKEFVIAIDTSGSTSGHLVQTFLNKTYNILKSTESFFSKINLHIIQCDADLQEHVKITSQEEFDEYMKNFKIKGLGGTDFRPVFTAVNELIEQKEFTRLKGLIYFTDGWGTFPEKMPDYQTAFVFMQDDYFNPEVPPWAIKLVLRSDEI